MNTVILKPDEPIGRHIRQEGVGPGPKKLSKFIEACKTRQTPAQYEQDGKGDDAIAYVKLFDPCGSWTWYVTAVSKDGSNEAFGLVYGIEKELGYFSLEELANTPGPMGIGIEIDCWFKPTRLGHINKKGNRSEPTRQ